MKNKIQSWKNADKAFSNNNPVSTVTVDLDIMSRVVGGQQAGGSEDCTMPPNIEALINALSHIRLH
jgi:hypothetical protein